MADSRPIVAHFIDGLGAGGAEALLVTNLRALGEGPFQHVVVTLFAPGSPAYPPAHHWEAAVKELGVPVIALDVRHRRALPTAVARLALTLRREHVAVLHTHLLWAGLVGRAAAKLARVPVVSSLHLLSYEPEILAGYRSPDSPKHRVMQSMERLSLRLADRVVAVGDAVAASARENLSVPPTRLSVVLNPVDFDALDAQPTRSRAALSSDASLTPGPLLLNVGRVVPQKNQLGLVEAMARVHERHPTAQLIILGALTDEPYVARVREAIDAAGLERHVHLLGVRRDVTAWMRACDVFAFPSTYEGLPIALIEAAGLGCTCVASDIAPNHEILEHGASGLLVPPENPEAFAAALVRVLDGQAQGLAEQARFRARAKFSPAQSAVALTQLYQSLLR